MLRNLSASRAQALAQQLHLMDLSGDNQGALELLARLEREIATLEKALAHATQEAVH
jgi:hypothetical protein